MRGDFSMAPCARPPVVSVFHIWRRRIFAGFAAFTVVLALGGCNAMKLGYQQGDRLAYWWVDRYVDVTDDQEPPTREAIARFFSWHRRAQLPEIANVLTRVKSEVAGPVDASMVRHAREDTQRLGRQAFENAIPDLADLMLTLTPEQIQRMESKFNESNAKYRKEFLKSDPQARSNARFDKVMDYAKLVYGKFSDDQAQKIRAAMGPYMQGADARYAERVKRQQEWLGIAREVSTTHPPKSQVEDMLRKYADHWQRPAAERAQIRQANEAGVDLTVTIANLTTPEQKAHAVDRFQKWIDDTRSLMREAGPSQASK
ncbi:hypothetical protein SAMN05216321_106311 [Cupriavidus sp. OV038]|jgi:hypothetical protein|nr:hypothetical protein SAMN05216321_106311 [Cupriavidus sp. OV038]SFO76065.1 hypothetical protein SAMN05216322_102311 [Cupriavidus sp. OV096]